VLAQPLVSKAGMRIKLCRPDGSAGLVTIPRRDKPGYARMRRIGWGDTVAPPSERVAPEDYDGRVKT
jgi:ribosomal protein RSM22 (predicted rRNA methylase)